MLLFSRIQSYYQAVGLELGLGRHPPRSLPAGSLVIVPVGSIRKLAEHALHAALSLGDDVIAVSVHPEASQSAAFRAEWDRLDPGVRLDTIDSPHRSLVHPIVEYVQRAQQAGRQVAVLIPEVQPRRWRYRILQNQRGLLLAAVLRASTDVVICTLPYGSPLDSESPGAHCARPDLPAASNAGASGQNARPLPACPAGRDNTRVRRDADQSPRDPPRRSSPAARPVPPACWACRPRAVAYLRVGFQLGQLRALRALGVREIASPLPRTSVVPDNHR